MMTEDFSAFFNTSEFADKANFEGVEVAVLFENLYINSFNQVENNCPCLRLPNSSVPVGVIEKLVTVRGISYHVAAKKTDEPEGLTVLLLEKA